MLGHVFLGRYETFKRLGHGSMGEVFLALDRLQPRQVVVKVMAKKLAGEERFREMFGREMQFMARFRHPHAVELYEASLTEPGGPCIVMEYVPGASLEQILQRHRVLHHERVGALLTQLCMALNAAHSSGIVHRDLKPSNMMVQNPDVPQEFLKVMDLGLALLTAKPYLALERLRGSGDITVAGTPAYVSPEQLRGDATDHRADLYSVGVMLFQLLTGRLPFADLDSDALLEAHVRRDPPKFKDVGMTQVPFGIESIVQRCLAKFPNERPQSALELAKVYRAALGWPDDMDPRWFEPVAVRPDAGTEPIPEQGSGRIQFVETLEAWMPEPIAVVKLRGFIEDAGGRVLESVPGRVRMRLGEPPPEPPKKSGIIGWLERATKTAPPPPTEPPIEPMEIDLHMTKKASQPQNRLELRVVCRALSGPLPNDPRWHGRLKKLMIDLRGYVMAQR
jgi:eukaryotic-like serine/threonine-protein kinase